MSTIQMSPPGVIAPCLNPWLIPRSQSAAPFQSWPSNYMPDSLACRSQNAAVYQQWFAGLLLEQIRGHVDEQTVIEGWLLRCPETDTRYRNPLLPIEVQEAFSRVMQVVEDYAEARSLTTIASCLYNDLRIALQREVSTIAGARLAYSSQHLFRAYAYVCGRLACPAFGEVLHNFFVRNLSTIVQQNGRKALWQYCRAIRDTCMEQHLKQDCYSRLQLHRPEVIDISDVSANQDIVRHLPSLIQAVIAAIRDVGTRLRPNVSSSRVSYGYCPWTTEDDIESHSSGYGTPLSRRALQDERKQLEEDLRRNRMTSRKLERIARRHRSLSPLTRYGARQVGFVMKDDHLGYDSDY